MTPPKDKAPGLVAAKLRQYARDIGLRSQTIDAAADRIEQLEAENAELRGKLERLNSEEGGFGDNLGSVAVSHLREMYGAAYDALGSSGRRSLRNFINARAALTEQANIRSPVQSQIRAPYEGEDGA